MFDYDALGTYVLVLTLVTMFVAVLLLRKNRTGRDIPIWLSAGVIGILLGAGGAAAAVHLFNYQLMKRLRPIELAEGDASSHDESFDSGGSDASGMEAGGGRGMGDAMGSGSGMGRGGGRGGSRGGGAGGAPAPKRELVSLIRKVELLTGDIQLDLRQDQKRAMLDILSRVDSQETMTDDQASAIQADLLAVLDEQQQAKQDAIGLPRRPSADPGGPPPTPAEDENPFAGEDYGPTLDTLLQRLRGDSSAEAASADDESTPRPESASDEATPKPELDGDEVTPNTEPASDEASPKSESDGGEAEPEPEPAGGDEPAPAEPIES